MAKLGYISEAARQRGDGARRSASRRGDLYTKIREPFFFDYVKQQLIDKFGVNTVRKGGLKVYTTIDPKLQKAGREAIDSTLHYPRRPELRGGRDRSRAPATSGRWRRARKYKHNQYNLAAQGHRQPGSAFKTFVLTTAIKRGHQPELDQLRLEAARPQDRGLRALEGPDLRPDLRRLDEPRARDAALRQHRLRAARPRPRPEERRRHRQGDGHHDQARRLSGRGPRRPDSAASRRSRWRTPTRRSPPAASATSRSRSSESKFPDGDVEDLGKPKRERVLSDAVAYEVTKILKQNVQQGTGTRANIGCPSAGKTGTTDNFNDAWFVGYTPQPRRRRVGRLPGRAARDAQRARHLGRGRNLPGGDLEQVHAGRQGPQLRRLPAARRARSAGRRSSASTRPGRLPDYSVRRQSPTATGDTTGGGYQGYDPAPLRRRRPTASPATTEPAVTEDGGGRAPARRHRQRTPSSAGDEPRRSSRSVRWRSSTRRWRFLCAAPGLARRARHGRRSPDWLLGPVARRSAPRSPTASWPARSSTSASGSRCSPTCVVLVHARASGPGSRSVAIVGVPRPLPARAAASLAGRVQLHLLRAARRRARADPYTHSPDDVPSDAAFAFAARRTPPASTGRSSRSPRFRSRSSSVPVAFWTLKAVAALASLGDRRAGLGLRAAPRPRPGAAPRSSSGSTRWCWCTSSAARTTTRSGPAVDGRCRRAARAGETALGRWR